MSSNDPTIRSRRNPVVAIAGATGAVGVELMQCLEQRKFPLVELRLLASARSAGKSMKFRGDDLPVRELTDASLEGVDIALFSAGGAQSKRFAPAAVRAGAVVVDNSSAFRMNHDVPLVVPEINAGAMQGHSGIIANPNCVAIVAATPLWPLHQKRRIVRITMSTYQAASGAGAAAMEELSESTRAHLEGRSFTPKVLPHPYAFNVFSHNTKVDPETGYNEEETKVMQETRKIFGEPGLRVTATCVRVPVLRAHCIALNIETEEPCHRPKHALSLPPRRECAWSMRWSATTSDAGGRQRQRRSARGRIRRDVSDPTGRTLALFVAGDQLRKGAALNAVQIAERLLA
jgi:aspartate-semialdehyde dehydrogenase